MVLYHSALVLSVGVVIDGPLVQGTPDRPYPLCTVLLIPKQVQW